MLEVYWEGAWAHRFWSKSHALANVVPKIVGVDVHHKAVVRKAFVKKSP